MSLDMVFRKAILLSHSASELFWAQGPLRRDDLSLAMTLRISQGARTASLWSNSAGWPGAIELHARFSTIPQLYCAGLLRCGRSNAAVPIVSNPLCAEHPGFQNLASALSCGCPLSPPPPPLPDILPCSFVSCVPCTFCSLNHCVLQLFSVLVLINLLLHWLPFAFFST